MSKKSCFIPADLLYEAIVDSSDDAIVSKDLQSIVMSWNPAAERMFGYTADEMIGQSISKLFPRDRLEEETEILARLQRGEQVDHFETIRRRKNGELIEVSLTISPIRNAQGMVVGASKIARDITSQKISQRRLAQANEELRRANQIKAEFLATLSHELRTPLNAILGWIQILKDDPKPEDVTQAVPIIERNVRVQSQLIEDLLDMSRIEAGKIKLDMRQIDLAALVAAGLESIRPSAEAKQIRLTSAFSNVFGTVTGDRDRLQQVLWNLLINAVKFTPKQGRIHTTIQRSGSHVEVSVSDTGQGIAPEFLPHVFDRFRQGDGATTRRHGGLGLGLSIVKHLAELHGGNVRAASDGQGRGSTFSLCLPLQSLHDEVEDGAEERRNAEVDRGAIKADLNGIKVLVVDDEQDSVAIVRRILERRGARVRGAHSMNEALAEFAAFSPNVILSDIGMPGNDGYEFIGRLRGMPGGRSVPAVALTALARGEDRTRALRAGFQMHVAKPVDFTELIAVVQNLAALRTDDR